MQQEHGDSRSALLIGIIVINVLADQVRQLYRVTAQHVHQSETGRHYLREGGDVVFSRVSYRDLPHSGLVG